MKRVAGSPNSAKPMVALYPDLYAASLFLLFIFSLVYPNDSAAEDMTVSEILAQGCTITPTNFSLNSEWNNRMSVIASFCEYPTITQFDINGLRKPKAFATGSSLLQHDRWGAAILNGDGSPPSPDDLGTAPNTEVIFGEFCTDSSILQSQAQNGDIVFTLRDWSDSCTFLDPGLKTIPIVGFDNDHRFVGDTRYTDRILLTYGSNYGQAIDYYTTGSRRISYTMPEFGGIVIALNTALIEKGHPPLIMANIKNVLDASSDEVYLEVGGYWNIYKEYQVDALLQNPNNKYFGQVINLGNAIDLVVNTASELPRLTLINEVNNVHGGQAHAEDFTLSANAETFVRGIPQDVAPGSYDLDALGVTGYSIDAWECTGGHQADENTLTLAFNQQASCSVMLNDIAPEITIVKSVVNENGGILNPGDFTLRLSGGSLPASVERHSGDTVSVTAYTRYTLREDRVEGYSRTGTSCLDNDTGLYLGHPVRLSEGQGATCTISNIDRPDEGCSFHIVPVEQGGAAAFCL